MKIIEIWSTKECIPCKQLRAHLYGKVDFDRVITKYVEDNQEEARKLKIASVPAIFFMDDGVIKESDSGYNRLVVKKIVEWLE